MKILIFFISVVSFGPLAAVKGVNSYKPDLSINRSPEIGNSQLISIWGTGLGIIGIMAGTVATYDSDGNFAFVSGLVSIGFGVVGTIAGTLGWKKAVEKERELEKTPEFPNIPENSIIILVARDDFTNFSFDDQGFFESDVNGVRRNLVFGGFAEVRFLLLGFANDFKRRVNYGLIYEEIKFSENLICKIRLLKEKADEVRPSSFISRIFSTGSKDSSKDCANPVIGVKVTNSAQFTINDFNELMDSGYSLRFFRIYENVF